MNRVGLKLACLAVSLVIWIRVATTVETEATIALPVMLENLGAEYTSAGSDLPEMVQVRVRGSKLRLLTHNLFQRRAGRIAIDLVGRTDGPLFIYEITTRDIRTELSVEEIYEPNVRLRIDRQITRRLPVRAVLTESLPADRRFLTEPVVRPDTVSVSGPERFFVDEMAVQTEAVALGGLEASQQFEAPLVAPGEHLTLAAETAMIELHIAAVVGRTLTNVPVVPLIDADQDEVAVWPPVADIMIRGAADSVSALLPARINITIPLSGLADGVHHLAGQVTGPEWLTHVAVEPEEFMVIIGEAQSADPKRQQP